jgi:hypothetical protein
MNQTQVKNPAKVERPAQAQDPVPVPGATDGAKTEDTEQLIKTLVAKAKKRGLTYER